MGFHLSVAGCQVKQGMFKKHPWSRDKNRQKVIKRKKVMQQTGWNYQKKRVLKIILFWAIRDDLKIRVKCCEKKSKKKCHKLKYNSSVWKQSDEARIWHIL